jgi:8-oxo-dGTP pyrophosphatase MutT (NUDIX family)
VSQSDPELQSSRHFPAPQRPRDSATLIVIRRDGPKPRVLLGRRHAAHAFMPGKFVFPGGRLDPHDTKIAPVADLGQDTLARLMMRMRGRASVTRARGLALAAVRETFEETGFILGSPHNGAARSPGGGWDHFLATGHAPVLSELRFFARAITPPGRTRRFDSRFFVADAANIANLHAAPVASEELLETHWFDFGEAMNLDLPSITADILGRLKMVLDRQGWPDETDPISFQYQRNGKWRDETL